MWAESCLAWNEITFTGAWRYENRIRTPTLLVGATAAGVDASVGPSPFWRRLHLGMGFYHHLGASGFVSLDARKPSGWKVKNRVFAVICPRRPVSSPGCGSVVVTSDSDSFRDKGIASQARHVLSSFLRCYSAFCGFSG